LPSSDGIVPTSSLSFSCLEGTNTECHQDYTSTETPNYLLNSTSVKKKVNRHLQVAKFTHVPQFRGYVSSKFVAM
jgi:hypothetical protein